MSIEERWREATEYLIESDYPEIVTAIRAYGLAVLEATLPPRKHSGPKTAGERRYLAVRARIAKLGNEEG